MKLHTAADVLRDIEFRADADWAYSLVRDALKDPERWLEESEISGARVYFLPMSKLTKGEWDDLAILFSTKPLFGERSLASFVSLPKRGQNFIVLLVKKGERPFDSLQRLRSLFIHEFIHYLDFKRGVPSPRERERRTDPTEEEYLSDPAEFNAWYQAIVDDITSTLWDLSGGELQDLLDLDFEDFYSVMAHALPDLKRYLGGAGEKYYRKFLSRLYQEWVSWTDPGGVYYEKVERESG
jgi:hypothetical protein